MLCSVLHQLTNQDSLRGVFDQHAYLTWVGERCPRVITVERTRHARRDFCDPRSRGARSRCLCDAVGASHQIHTVQRLDARTLNGDRDHRVR